MIRLFSASSYLANAYFLMMFLSLIMNDSHREKHLVATLFSFDLVAFSSVAFFPLPLTCLPLTLYPYHWLFRQHALPYLKHSFKFSHRLKYLQNRPLLRTYRAFFSVGFL